MKSLDTVRQVVHRRKLCGWLTWVLMILASAPGSRPEAQTYSIGWYTIDGGGGASSGGNYALEATIGQLDAGTALSGGSYTLQGGFWPGVLVPLHGQAPTLFVQVSGGSVVISWAPSTTGFELEAAEDLASPVWISVGDAGPVTVPIGGAARFYRMKQP